MPLDEVRWETWLVKLREFKSQNGHCNVPKKHPGGLGHWADHQRRSHKGGRLDRHRVRKLEEEGFRWALYEDRWDARLEQLREFRREHGHCNVPHKHPGGLGSWVHQQRRDHKQGERRLDLLRIRKLEDEGFKWRIANAHDSRRDDTSGGSDPSVNPPTEENAEETQTSIKRAAPDEVGFFYSAATSASASLQPMLDTTSGLFDGASTASMFSWGYGVAEDPPATKDPVTKAPVVKVPAAKAAPALVPIAGRREEEDGPDKRVEGATASGTGKERQPFSEKEGDARLKSVNKPKARYEDLG